MHLVDSWANVNRWRNRPVEMVFLAGGLLVLALVLPPIPCGLAILFVSASAACLGARIPFLVYARVLAVPLSFLVAGSAALAFSVGFPDGGGLTVSFSSEGALTALTVVVRSFSAVSALMLLALTIPIAELLSLLRRGRVPAVFIELMSLIYRLLFVFDATVRSLMRAQSCRLGYVSLRTSYRSLGAAAASLFIRALDRAQRLETGLRSRGYEGELTFLSCRHRPSTPALVAIGVVHLGLVGLALAWHGAIAWPR